MDIKTIFFVENELVIICLRCEKYAWKYDIVNRITFLTICDRMNWKLFWPLLSILLIIVRLHLKSTFDKKIDKHIDRAYVSSNVVCGISPIAIVFHHKFFGNTILKRIFTYEKLEKVSASCFWNIIYVFCLDRNGLELSDLKAL